MPVPDFLLTPEFWFGAVALCVFQFGKFNELNSIDPSFLRLSHIPNLRASDFAGPQAFAGALGLFLAFTLVMYFLLCLASPTLLIGVAKVTQGQPSADQISEFVNSVPYPLYIVVGFMGIAQQAVPGLSKVANIQRDVFHYLLGVPRRAVQMVNAVSAQMFAKGSTREQLSQRIDTMVGYEWIAGMEQYADVGFYRLEIERLKLASESEIEETKQGSTREMRYAIEQLVYAAAIATIRTSGISGLKSLAKALSLSFDLPNGRLKDALRTGFVWYLLGLTFLIFAVPMLREAFAGLTGNAIPLWPATVEASAAYVLAQVAPVLISALLLVAFVTLEPTRNAPLERRSAFGLLNRHAGFVLLIIAAVVALDYVQTLLDYGWYNHSYEGGIFGFVVDWFPYHVLHSFASVTACLIIIWYFTVFAGVDSRDGIWRALSSIIVVVGGVAIFYATARSVFQFQQGILVGYVVLIAILNIIAAMIAFFAVLSVKRRAPEILVAPAE